jgi:hypothetical protein
MSTATKSDQIASLRKRISKIDVEIEEIKDEQRRQSTQVNTLIDERKRMADMLEAMTPKKLNVTDHALLRYVERVLGIDIEAIRNTIISEKVESLVAAVGDAKVPIGDGVYAVVRNHNVVTIATSDMVVKKPAHKRSPRDKNKNIDSDIDKLQSED